VRIILFLVISLLIFQEAECQSFWAKKQAGVNVDETLDVVSDDFGNSFSVGYFSTTANVNESDVFVEGLTDIFVSMVTQNGSTQWVRSFGGVQSDRGLSIAVDDFGLHRRPPR